MTQIKQESPMMTEVLKTLKDAGISARVEQHTPIPLSEIIKLIEEGEKYKIARDKEKIEIYKEIIRSGDLKLVEEMCLIYPDFRNYIVSLHKTPDYEFSTEDLLSLSNKLPKGLKYYPPIILPEKFKKITLI